MSETNLKAGKLPHFVARDFRAHIAHDFDRRVRPILRRYSDVFEVPIRRAVDHEVIGWRLSGPADLFGPAVPGDRFNPADYLPADDGRPAAVREGPAEVQAAAVSSAELKAAVERFNARNPADDKAAVVDMKVSRMIERKELGLRPGELSAALTNNSLIIFAREVIKDYDVRAFVLKIYHDFENKNEFTAGYGNILRNFGECLVNGLKWELKAADEIGRARLLGPRFRSVLSDYKSAAAEIDVEIRRVLSMGADTKIQASALNVVSAEIKRLIRADDRKRKAAEKAAVGPAAEKAAEKAAVGPIAGRAAVWQSIGLEIPRAPVAKGDRLTSSRDVYAAVLGRFPDMPNYQSEVFGIITLNAKNTLIDIRAISAGSQTAALINGPACMLSAVLDQAAGVVLFHNHPSGIPTPSKEDTEITAELVKAFCTLKVRVLDHIIIGDQRYYSFADQGTLPNK